VFRFIVLEWSSGAPICEFLLQISSDVTSADFYFDTLFADSSDSRYLKGVIIENEKTVYDIMLEQCDSVRSNQAASFPEVFCNLFNNAKDTISDIDLDIFRELGVNQSSPPATLLEYHEKYQIPLTDLLIKTGRSGLIESALKYKHENQFTFNDTLTFVTTVLYPLITKKSKELTHSISRNYPGSEALMSSSADDFDRFIENEIKYFQDLDRVV
jgi:hypothetical protein